MELQVEVREIGFSSVVRSEARLHLISKLVLNLAVRT